MMRDFGVKLKENMLCPHNMTIIEAMSLLHVRNILSVK